ncbi:Ger(x)C family spore germination protein [Cytobacillus oceanisediminis]|uniref:Ger(x)C family spore germination protein n=1 Tax=Cytobacillus oceanisediminis TaxID=665099 RepID=UPI0023DAFA51|nr:Ger(x)C family spore germination protein [Cytobacillus oceanisediminis]MDF2036131.1 Ger(x)C family spore germination protein [Cytobacillus oceanisediminis]
MRKALSVLLIIGLLSGCSNYKELNDVGLIIAIGIDLPKERDSGYRVTYQVINPNYFSKNSSGSSLPVINYTVEAETFIEAYRMATVIIPRENRVTHLSLIVIGEALAREGLGLIFDVFERGESRSTFPVFIARESTAEEILGVVEPLESNPTKSIISTSENNQKLYAISRVTPIYRAISLLSSEGQNLMLSGVKLSNPLKSENQTENLQNIKPSIVEVTGLAMFKNDQLAGWFDGKFARTAHLINSAVESTSFPLACKGKKHITITTKGLKSAIKTELKPKPTLVVDTKIRGYIAELECYIKIGNEEEIKKLEKKLKEEAESQIRQTIKMAQDMETDVFGFGKNLSKDNPKYWKKHKKEWSTLFSNADIEVNVETKISNSGLLTDPYKLR